MSFYYNAISVGSCIHCYGALISYSNGLILAQAIGFLSRLYECIVCYYNFNLPKTFFAKYFPFLVQIFDGGHWWAQ